MNAREGKLFTSARKNSVKECIMSDTSSPFLTTNFWTLDGFIDDKAVLTSHAQDMAAWCCDEVKLQQIAELPIDPITKLHLLTTACWMLGWMVGDCARWTPTIPDGWSLSRWVAEALEHP